MCECEKRIEELKKIFKIAINTLHDTIVDISQESEEWNQSFYDEIDVINEHIEAI